MIAYLAVVIALALFAKGGWAPWQIPTPLHPSYIFGHLFFPNRQPAPTGYEPTFTYLGSPQRIANDPSSLRWPLRLRWSSFRFNWGVHSASKGSPAIDESGIYVGGDNGRFYAFNHDGSVRWSFETGRQVQGLHGSPLLDKKRVYVGAYNGRVYCFEKISGALIWAVKVGDAVGSSPAMLDGDLIVSTETDTRLDGYLLRLDARSGRVLWRSRSFEQQVHSSPTISADGRLAFVGDNLGNYHAIDTHSGITVWTTKLGQPIKGTGAFLDGKIYVASWDKFLWALRAENGEVLWKVPLRGRSQSSPVIVDDVAVLGSHSPGYVYAISLRTNHKLWEKKIHVAGGMGSAVAVKVGGQPLVLTYCDENRLCLIEPTSGKVRGEIVVPGLVSGVPAIWREQVYVALNEGGLIKLAY